jgi:hypothetical protein
MKNKSPILQLFNLFPSPWLVYLDLERENHLDEGAGIIMFKIFNLSFLLRPTQTIDMFDKIKLFCFTPNSGYIY